MLDYFVVFSRGGLVLWSQTNKPLADDSVNKLIRAGALFFVSALSLVVHRLCLCACVLQTVLLEERASASSWTNGEYALDYAFDNERDLVFVVRFDSLKRVRRVPRVKMPARRRRCTSASCRSALARSSSAS